MGNHMEIIRPGTGQNIDTISIRIHRQDKAELKALCEQIGVPMAHVFRAGAIRELKILMKGIDIAK
jgi:hypothetical protein